MANIKNLEMATALSNDSRISIISSFLGLRHKALYLPTNSSIEAFQYEFSSENGEVWKRLLNCSDNQFNSLIQQFSNMQKAAMGPVRVEGCKSHDHQFAALQVLAYSDFEYRPLTEVRIYEREKAELICSIL